MITITPLFSSFSKTYDGTTSAINLTYNLSGVVNSEPPNITYDASFDNPNVGNNKEIYITNITNSNPNYTLSTTYLTINGSITQAITNNYNYNLIIAIVTYIKALSYNKIYISRYIKTFNNN